MNVTSGITQRYISIVGVTPIEFAILMAVLSYQRTFGADLGPSRKQIEALVGKRINTALLVRNRWLTAEGSPPSKQQLRATSRAWNNLWPWRQGWPEEDQKTA